jgi:hypothetical protein
MIEAASITVLNYSLPLSHLKILNELSLAIHSRFTGAKGLTVATQVSALAP